MRRGLSWFCLLAAPLLLGGWVAFHIELRESRPGDGEALTEAPQEIWLKFSVPPDTSRSSFSVRGPDGAIQLDSILWRPDEDPAVLSARVMGEMSPGAYTISWTAAPMDDHGARGRVGFTLTQDR